MAFNPDEGEVVDNGFNPDLGEPVDTGFNPDAGEPISKDTAQPTTYKYASPEEYELLKRNVAEVGYSGLDENQKKLFDAQMSASKAFRAGMSPDQIHEYVDQAAGVNEANANAGNAWTLGRSILSLPVAALGGLIGGFDKYEQDPVTGQAVERMPGSSYWERVGADQNAILEAAKNNQGFSGFASNPANVIGGVVSAPFKVAGPFVRGAIEGAGVSAIDQYANTGKVGLANIVGGGLLGGTISKAGSMLGSRVKEYQDYNTAKEMLDTDPLTYMWDHPQMEANSNLMNKYSDKVDPKGLYEQYTWASDNIPTGSTAKLDPIDQADLLKKAKEDIIERSLFNRKGSSVTDREAREHIEDIIQKIDDFKVGGIPAPVNPLLSTKAKIASAIEGTPGLNFLDNGGVRGISSTLTPVANGAIRLGASPIGGLLRNLPLIPMASTGIDRLSQ